jgi:hypothetical protein
VLFNTASRPTVEIKGMRRVVDQEVGTELSVTVNPVAWQTFA